MLLNEPPPSQGDLHFRVLGIPVRVHPLFWAATVMLGIGGLEGAPPGDLLMWAGVVFVSVLVHELGHALLQRRFGGRPWITLLAFGGLSSCQDCDRRPSRQIAISLAGPAAGFLLAATVLLALVAAGRRIGFASAGQLAQSSLPEMLSGWRDASGISLPAGALVWESLTSANLNRLVGDLLSVNILWGLINLLPIYPLDGGRVARELLTLRQPRPGIVWSLQLSIVAAVGMALFAALSWRSYFSTLFFGLLAYENYRALQQYRLGW